MLPLLYLRCMHTYGASELTYRKFRASPYQGKARQGKARQGKAHHECFVHYQCVDKLILQSIGFLFPPPKNWWGEQMKNAVELRPLSPTPLTAIEYSSADVEHGNTRLPLSDTKKPTRQPHLCQFQNPSRYSHSRVCTKLYSTDMVTGLLITIAQRWLAFIITEKYKQCAYSALSSHYQTKYKASYGGASLS